MALRPPPRPSLADTALNSLPVHLPVVPKKTAIFSGARALNFLLAFLALSSAQPKQRTQQEMDKDLKASIDRLADNTARLNHICTLLYARLCVSAPLSIGDEFDAALVDKQLLATAKEEIQESLNNMQGADLPEADS